MSAPHPRTLDLLARLVAEPTVSGAPNAALMDGAEALLRAAGAELYRFAHPDDPARRGLAMRLGPAGPGGVLLSAHSDVVPVEGQTWTRPPFALTVDGSRLYGRGATDMKGFLAAMLALAERAGAAPLRAPLMLVISYDEEVGCQGIAHMMPQIAALGWAPALTIVGEPTGMHPAIGHKGKAAFRATCHGTSGHSALAPLHVNALHLAGDLLAALRLMQAEYSAAALRDIAYDVPYSTVHVGMMQGGRALNIVPDRAELTYEVRHLPGDDPAEFEARIAAESAAVCAALDDPAARIEIARLASYPGLEVAPDAPQVRHVAALAGGRAAPIKVGFGTEAGVFAAAGFPAVVCGPGDMAAQGHKADEYLERAQLAACDRMMDRILTDLCR